MLPKAMGALRFTGAAYRNDPEMARLLVEAGADIRATTRLGELTPLFMACQKRQCCCGGALAESRS